MISVTTITGPGALAIAAQKRLGAAAPSRAILAVVAHIDRDIVTTARAAVRNQCRGPRS